MPLDHTDPLAVKRASQANRRRKHRQPRRHQASVFADPQVTPVAIAARVPG